MPALLLPESAALAPKLIDFDFGCEQKPRAPSLDACRGSPRRRHRFTSCSTTTTDDGEWDKESAVSIVMDGFSDAGGTSDEDRCTVFTECPSEAPEDVAIRASGLLGMAPDAAALKMVSSAPFTRDSTPTEVSTRALPSPSHATVAPGTA